MPSWKGLALPPILFLFLILPGCALPGGQDGQDLYCAPFFHAEGDDPALAEAAFAADPAGALRVERRMPQGLATFGTPRAGWVLTLVEWVPDATPEGLRPERGTDAFTLADGNLTVIASADRDEEELWARVDAFLRNVSSASEAERADVQEALRANRAPAASRGDPRDPAIVVSVAYSAPVRLPLRAETLLDEVLAADEPLPEVDRALGERQERTATWRFDFELSTVTLFRADAGASAALYADTAGRLTARVTGTGDPAEARAALDALLADAGWRGPAPTLALVTPPCPHGD